MKSAKIISKACVRIGALSMLCFCTACNGIFSGIYDEAPDDNSFVQGIVATDSHGGLRLMLDATSYTDWHFIDLHALTIEKRDIPMTLTGEWDGRSGITYNHIEGSKYIPISLTKTNAQEVPQNWDFAIHHFDVRTNGGEAIETPFTSLSQLPPSPKEIPGDYQKDIWSTTQVIVDFRGMLNFDIGYQNSYVNPVLCKWVEMDFSTPPPIYTATGKVYLLRLKDGTTAALLLKSYMNDNGIKGFLTVDIRYPY